MLTPPFPITLDLSTINPICFINTDSLREIITRNTFTCILVVLRSGSQSQIQDIVITSIPVYMVDTMPSRNSTVDNRPDNTMYSVLLSF